MKNWGRYLMGIAFGITAEYLYRVDVNIGAVLVLISILVLMVFDIVTSLCPIHQKKHFIAIQMIVEEEFTKDNVNNISMANVVRQVEAESREEAVGKFLIATNHFKAKKKLNIECYDLSELLSVE